MLLRIINDIKNTQRYINMVITILTIVEES